MYASGSFTRVVFAISEGDLVLGVPRMHHIGHAGDLVNTIVSPTAPMMWR